MFMLNSNSTRSQYRYQMLSHIYLAHSSGYRVQPYTHTTAQAGHTSLASHTRASMSLIFILSLSVTTLCCVCVSVWDDLNYRIIYSRNPCMWLYVWILLLICFLLNKRIFYFVVYFKTYWVQYNEHSPANVRSNIATVKTRAGGYADIWYGSGFHSQRRDALCCKTKKVKKKNNIIDILEYYLFFKQQQQQQR